jgi:hypothetical protein
VTATAPFVAAQFWFFFAQKSGPFDFVLREKPTHSYIRKLLLCDEEAVYFSPIGIIKK